LTFSILLEVTHKVFAAKGRGYPSHVFFRYVGRFKQGWFIFSCVFLFVIGSFINLIQVYSADKLHFVRLESLESVLHCFNCGVRQGLVLGSLLFFVPHQRHCD